MNALKRLLTFMAVVLAMTQTAARAEVLDVSIPGAQFTRTGASNDQFVVSYDFSQPAGTGYIDPFLQVKTNETFERAYNTDAIGVNGTKVLDAGDTSNYNHSITLGQIPIVSIGGVRYREFALDANQQFNGPISLTQVQLFVSTDPGATYSNLTEASGSQAAVISFSGLTQVFQMSGGSTQYDVHIDSGHGSGTADMFIYVADNVFNGQADSSKVTLFSQFGNPPGTLGANDGFEEWKLRTGVAAPAVPEPSTLAIAGLGALGFAGYGLRRRLKK